MGGTTLTIVPSGVGSPLAMHRSQSTPDFFAPTPSPNSLAGHHQNLSTKSLPDLPDQDVAPIDIDFNIDFDSSTLCFGTDFLDSGKQEQQVQKAMAIRPGVGSDSQRSPRGQKNASNPYVASEKKFPAKDTKTTRTWTLTSRPKSWLPGFRPAPDARDTSKEYQKSPSPDPEATESAAAGRDDRGTMAPIERSRTASGSFPSSYSRTARDPYSRSPSPPHVREPLALDGGNRGRSSSDSSAKAKLTKRRPASTVVETTATPTESGMPRPKRASTFFSIKSRPQNVFVRTLSVDDLESCTSSDTSFAQTTGDIGASQSSSEGGDTTVTDDTSATSDVPASPAAPQRDPLWRAFKNLEIEYAKFEPKPASVRMAFLRSNLVPFLKAHASHPSNRGLKPALLEFRANILDKWWNGMLQMLDGRKVGHVPGVDRPELLEMITMVMMRPEWRQSATYFLPLVDRSPSERVKTLRARSFTSISDGESTSSASLEFFAESALHNVRTMFIANLIKQMTIVVDKLSLRNASPSLINFAGKASAYAFTFAPGCAEVLVRLWGLTPDLIRRAADEFGLPRRNNGESEDICALFPPCVQPLGWTSATFLSEYLKQPARLPPLVARANWYGPWGSKWRGKESDVFYIFVKYFYRLSEEFMPSGLPLLEKARSPAFVLVQAQMLGVLDETIHRQAAFDAMMGLPFGDSLDGADASVTALAPFGSSNLLKGMDQNRMIMLLKNFIADHSVLASRARDSFAEAFICLVKAATKRTSQFDHSACFTLCDFLEEALSTFTSEKGYYDISRLVDWPFWFDVCRKILDNENTMSTIRVLSFIFTMWDVIVADTERKEALCRNWLVSEDMFTKLFTHWCPMVRAYYMRLLCWRICRDSGRSDEADMRIFQLVAKHLKTAFHNYEWLRSTAETQRKFLPSTAPCYPTPGKKFMIIRTQVGSPLPGTVPRDFDAFSTSFTTPSGIDGPAIQPPSFSPPDPQPRSEGKKRWSLLGKVLSLNTANAQRTTMDEDLEAVRREMAASRRRSASPTGPPPPPKPGFATPASEDDEESNPDSPTARGVDYVFKFMLSPIPPHVMPPLERILRLPRLPAPAQARVLARERPSNDLVRAGLPAATRRYSGAGYTGLVAGARNADPTDEVYDPSPCGPSERSSFSSRPGPIGTQESRETAIPSGDEVGLKPEGREKMARAKYTGKALAEWGLVVAECNAFVERRRDEGMLGLADVEVPQLGVEWFQKFA